MDVRAYLQRRSDELVADIGRRTTALGARSWMEGAVRALEALDALDRQAGQDVMDDFDRRLRDEGAAEQVVLSHSVRAGVSAREGPTAGAKAEEPPELEGVVAIGHEASLPDDVRVAVLHLTLWNTGAEVSWAIIAPEGVLREYRTRPRIGGGQASTLPWDLDAWDDVGTRYRVSGGSGSGTANRLRAEVRLDPRIPPEATELTLSLRDPLDGRELLQTSIALTDS